MCAEGREGLANTVDYLNSIDSRVIDSRVGLYWIAAIAERS